MQRIQQGAAVCFVIFSALVVWGSLSLEYYTKLGTGAGFFPLWLGVAMGGLSLVWLAQVSRRTGKPPSTASLDIFEGEPLRADSSVRAQENVYLSPHVGGVTADSRQLSGNMAAENLIYVLKGERHRGILNPDLLAH